MSDGMYVPYVHRTISLSVKVSFRLFWVKGDGMDPACRPLPPLLVFPIYRCI